MVGLWYLPELIRHASVFLHLTSESEKTSENPPLRILKEGKIIKILFVSPSFKPFIKEDYEILTKKFQVQNVVYDHAHKSSLLLLIPRIFVGTLWADITYSWFGSFHAFLTVLFSRLFHKKSIVVAGGYDVAKMTEIGYGLMSMRFWRFFPIFSFKNCDKILAVSEHTRREIKENMDVDDRKIIVIRHGFNKDRFFPRNRKEDIVVTVAEATPQTLVIKGLTDFVKTANLLPNTKFYLIGKGEKESICTLRKINQHNLIYKGFVPHRKLATIMQRAKVYVQISAHESFGCALAEAMLCECIPVVTACGAIPEVVGNTGYYVPYGDIKAIAETVERALRDGETRGKNARKRIAKEFPIEKRENALIEIVKQL